MMRWMSTDSSALRRPAASSSTAAVGIVAESSINRAEKRLYRRDLHRLGQCGRQAAAMIYDIQMPAAQKTQLDAAILLAWAKQHRPQMVSWIQRAVEQESPSSNKPALDGMCALLAGQFGALGGAVKVIGGPAGNHLHVNFETAKATAKEKKLGRI